MPTLTDEIKTYIVKRLACFDTPSYVAECVKTNFDIEITRQHVYAYDPESSQAMAPRWSAIHAATRAKFLQQVSDIGISQKAVRLRMLDRLAHRCERNSVALAMACLEQAAKECGGIYENRRPVVLNLSVPQPQAPPPVFAADVVAEARCLEAQCLEAQPLEGPHPEPQRLDDQRPADQRSGSQESPYLAELRRRLSQRKEQAGPANDHPQQALGALPRS